MSKSQCRLARQFTHTCEKRVSAKNIYRENSILSFQMHIILAVLIPFWSKYRRTYLDYKNCNIAVSFWQLSFGHFLTYHILGSMSEMFNNFSKFNKKNWWQITLECWWQKIWKIDGKKYEQDSKGLINISFRTKFPNHSNSTSSEN